VKVCSALVDVLPLASVEATTKKYWVAAFKPLIRREWAPVKVLLRILQMMVAVPRVCVANVTRLVLGSFVVHFITVEVVAVDVAWTPEITGPAMSGATSVVNVISVEVAVLLATSVDFTRKW